VASLRKGLSGMHAATTAWIQEVEKNRMPEPRAMKGQGLPYIGGPHPGAPLEQSWSEGPAAGGPGARGRTFCLLLAGPSNRRPAKSGANGSE
jgi:hypothetical protein